MPKEPKPNFASFTKAELVKTAEKLTKTVDKLYTRQTKLLNEIAQLKAQIAHADVAAATHADLTEANMLRIAEEHFGEAALRDEWEREGAPEYTDDATDAVPRKPFPWEKD